MCFTDHSCMETLGNANIFLSEIPLAVSLKKNLSNDANKFSKRLFYEYMCYTQSFKRIEIT